MNEALMRAIFDGDVSTFDSLVREGIDAKSVTALDHWNLLHRALVSLSIRPHNEIIRKLIALGVDVNGRDRFGNTPLHYAARIKDPGLIATLLDSGAAIDPVNRDGLTPLRLMLTSKPTNLQAIELFLARGANVAEKAPGGVSTTEYAKTISHGKDQGIIELFTKYGHL